MTDHEELFLACILNDPQIIFSARITEAQLIQPKPRRLLRAMKKCAETGLAIDYISLGDMDRELDPAYAPTLRDKVPSGANWKYYEDLVIMDYQRRGLVSIGKVLATLDLQSDPVAAIDEAEKNLYRISTGIASSGIKSVSEILPATMRKIEERHKLKGQLPGLSTGLAGLDFMTGGLQDSQFVVIGARPSEGKSALALNMACHLSIVESVPVGFISAESSETEVIMRVLEQTGRIDGMKLMVGIIDFPALIDAAQRIQPAPLYICDTPNIRLSEVKSIARQMVMSHKVKAIFVDYIQIIDPEADRIPRHEQIARISIALKHLARELKIPIIALSQLRRDADGREPQMPDLSDSSQLEKDADVLVFIYHPRVAEGDAPKPSKLIVKKARDGKCGAIDVIFKREYVSFHEMERQQ